MSSAPPILWMPIFTADLEDHARLIQALAAISQSDPGVVVRIDPNSEEVLFSGTSLKHLQDTFEELTHEYSLPVWKGEPRVRFLETISNISDAEGKYIRQTGGSGNYGHVKIRLEPSELGRGFEFVNEIEGATIPKEYINPIEMGIREAALGGILAACEVVDFKATLYDGSYHDVDSNEMAFRIAGSLAFKEAAKKANPVLLEPVMAVEVTVPEEHMDTIIRDINARRGRIESMEHVGGSEVIKATVPLDELLGYANELHSRFPDRVSCTMEFARYESRPYGMLGDGDEAGSPVTRPRGPAPRSGSAAIDLDFDWT
jgi:elongation factor G